MAHGAALRVLGKNPYLPDQVVANHRHAELTPREAAIVDLAVKLTKTPGAVTAADLEPLRALGLSEVDIWDVGAVTAFFNLSNRMASLADMRPNGEFYGMGRASA